MSKAIKWILFALACAGLIAALVFFSNESKNKYNVFDQNQYQVASELNGNIKDHVKGKTDSKVILIEYADYQCPGCAYYNPIITSVVDDYKDKILYIYRSYLLEYHPNAKAAAATAEAAGFQGKFWEMHDLLFSRQTEWESLDIDARTNYFVELASELELDTNKFRSDLASTSITKKLAFDRNMAYKSGLTATPALYLNGKAVTLDDVKDEDGLKKLLDDAIDEANK